MKRNGATLIHTKGIIIPTLRNTHAITTVQDTNVLIPLHFDRKDLGK
jgi:hypothetical protein